MCVCAEGKQVTSRLHIRFPRTEPGEKLFDYAQWKHFCLLRPWERDGLIREHGPGLWEKALKVGRAFFSFISAVLLKKMQAVPFLKNEGGSDHGRPSFHRWFHFFFSHCDSSQPSCNRCSSILLLLGWTPDQKQLRKKMVIWLALQVTIYPWGKPGQELKTGTWEPWKKVACWIVLCWHSYTDLGSPS